ncbi:putative defense protein Hdd11-like [Leptidea sinapis]|uniref:putative defense protein Hdd11-like n=1 Tax=Leptidea sinapis TaxID=189913 RepID=UPI002138C4F9|nr:putative defense protein Hdd11-like [Leptidea sinapis]
MMFKYICIALALALGSEAYPWGAPTSACKDMIPRHNTEPQEMPAPYVVTTSSKVVKAGEQIQVTVSGMSPSDTVKGLMMQARAGEKPVGTFNIEDSNPVVQLMKCENDGDTVTHKRHDAEEDKQSITLTWTAPEDFDDVVKFRATIVLTVSKFWVGVESAAVKVTP